MRINYLLAASLVCFSISSLAKEILVVGDSLTCGPFGAALVKNLSINSDNNVTVFCAIGSAPDGWIKGTLPIWKTDPVTRKPTTFFDCKTCVGKLECADWFAHSPADDILKKCNGATPGTGPKFEDLIKQKKYDHVIVALGTNTLSDDSKTDVNYDKMLELIQKNKIPKCSWIGPPHLDISKRKARVAEEARLDDFYVSLGQTLKNSEACSLIDSRTLTANPQPEDTTRDGIHRQTNSARKWADGVTDLMKN